MKENEEKEFALREPITMYGKKKFTIEEYLEFEEASEQRHEYYQGEIFPLAPVTIHHNRINVNLIADIGRKLRGRGCRPFPNGQIVHAPSNTLFAYPDLSIICGEAETLNNDNWIILNPSVIIEILSPSTKTYDRNKKFELYKGIATLKEYILVDSKKIHIESYYKIEQGKWELTEYESLSDKLQIKTVKVSVKLFDVYEDVSFDSNFRKVIPIKKDRLV